MSMPSAWKPRWRLILEEGEAQEEHMCDCVSRGGLMTGQDASEGDKTEGVEGAYEGCTREYTGLRMMTMVYLIAPVATCTSG